jgi:aerobic-type carbon monoxide dehydrogenase small subunit (CoxS/CutS family)
VANGNFAISGESRKPPSVTAPTAAHLLRRHPEPTDADIDREMTNLCRCATYVRIRAAIHLAAKMARA